MYSFQAINVEDLSLCSLCYSAFMLAPREEGDEVSPATALSVFISFHIHIHISNFVNLFVDMCLYICIAFSIRVVYLDLYPLDSLSCVTLGNCNPRDRYDREQSLMTALPSLSAREKIMTRVKDDIVPLKEAFKWSVQGLIATELGGVSVATRVTLRNSQSLRLPQLLIMFTFIFASTFGTLEWWVNTDVLMVWVEMETMLKTNAIHL